VIVRKRDDWLTAQVGDEMVMMSANRGLYLGMTAIGARIWELIETPESIDTLCAQLLSEYEVEPGDCRAEVEAFLRDLASHGAVEIDPAPGA
jgi:hypothetical protein